MTTKNEQRWNFRDLMENPLYEQLIDLQVKNERLQGLLQRISEWDHMDSAADGPFWRAEIAKVLGSDNCH